MKNEIMSRPLWQLTVGELLEILGREQKTIVNNTPTPQKRLVYGIAGIAQIFNCSMTTANRIKKSGKIDKAISQHGRMIVIDVDLALELMQKAK